MSEGDRIGVPYGRPVRAASAAVGLPRIEFPLATFSGAFVPVALHRGGVWSRFRLWCAAFYAARTATVKYIALE